MLWRHLQKLNWPFENCQHFDTSCPSTFVDHLKIVANTQMGIQNLAVVHLHVSKWIKNDVCVTTKSYRIKSYLHLIHE
jgi:hypothetical protein